MRFVMLHQLFSESSNADFAWLNRPLLIVPLIFLISTHSYSCIHQNEEDGLTLSVNHSQAVQKIDEALCWD